MRRGGVVHAESGKALKYFHLVERLPKITCHRGLLHCRRLKSITMKIDECVWEKAYQQA